MKQNIKRFLCMLMISILKISVIPSLAFAALEELQSSADVAANSDDEEFTQPTDVVAISDNEEYSESTDATVSSDNEDFTQATDAAVSSDNKEFAQATDTAANSDNEDFTQPTVVAVNSDNKGFTEPVVVAVDSENEEFTEPAVATEHEDADIFIQVDNDGNVTIDPDIPNYGVVLDEDFIHIRLHMKIAPEAVSLSLPEGWAYEIGTEGEKGIESGVEQNEYSKWMTHTVVTIAHTWNSHAKEGDYVAITPLVTGGPFPVHNLPANATLSDWNTAMASGNRVINVQHNQNMNYTVTIPPGRQIIIASNGTNLSTSTTSGPTFTLNRTGNTTGRHFIVQGPNNPFNADLAPRLTLVNIILDGNHPGPGVDRGGVFVSWGGQLFMNNGAVITGCRGRIDWPEGGGVNLGNHARFEMSGGEIIRNYADSGAGVRQSALDPVGSTFIMHRGLIAGNEARAVNRRVIDTFGDGGGDAGGVLVQRNCTFTMHGGVIRDNSANFYGGGVVVRGTNANFEMNGGEIIDNHITIDGFTNARPIVRDGGGVWAGGGARFTMNGGLIAENTAIHDGGGVWLGKAIDDSTITDGAIFTMNGGVITDNIAGRDGGGIWAGHKDGVIINANARFTMSNGLITANTAQRDGGGAYAQNAILAMRNGTIGGTAEDANKAVNGGGVYLTGSSAEFTMVDGKIGNHTVAGSGAGIHMSNGSNFIMTGGAITVNEALGNGGGVYMYNSSAFTMHGGEITVNASLEGDGGGIFAGSNTTFSLSGSTPKDINYNEAKNGGGIWVAENAEMEMVPTDTTNISISHNIAIHDGGGIFTERFEYASILTPGAGVYDNLTIAAGTIFSGNVAAIWFFSPLIQSGVNNQLPNIRWDPAMGSSIQYDDEYLYLLNNYDINFRSRFTTLSISKEMTGKFGNQTMEFEFTILFEDANGNPLSAGTQFDYIGDTLSGLGGTAPKDGRLTLNSAGSATFRLAHGQTIRIEDVPLDASIRIIEKTDVNYRTRFIDCESADPADGKGANTGLRPMTVDRAFSFVNDRVDVPRTGIDLGNTGALLLMFALVTLTVLAAFMLSTVYRRKKTR